MPRAPLTAEASIRLLGAIEYLAVRDQGQPRLAVAAVSGADAALTQTLLDDIAAAHGRIAHPRVPALVGRATLAGRPCVVLECDARHDLHQLATLAFERGIPIGADAAVGFSLACLEMLAAVHAAGGPCLGAFNAANVLVAPNGRFHFVGWGHPVAATARGRLLAALPPSFLAPEVMLGAQPVPGSDLTAASLFFHSFLNLGALPEAALRGMRGEGTPELADKIAALVHSSHAARPEDRSLSRFLTLYREILPMLSVTPDVAGMETLLAAVAAADPSRRDGRLEIATDGRWFRLGDGPPVDLTRRGTQRRLLLALARLRISRPGVPIGWLELFAAGWPDQRSAPESARSRVYVAISALRGHGLRDCLHTSDQGYFLDPALAVSFSDGQKASTQPGGTSPAPVTSLRAKASSRSQ